MEPVICYSCLDVFHGDDIRATALLGCSAGRHALHYHESCAARIGGCAHCLSPFPSTISVLCGNAIQKLSSGSKERWPSRFIEEVDRLCKGAGAGADRGLHEQQEARLAALYRSKAPEALLDIAMQELEDTVVASRAMRALAALLETGYHDPEHRLRTSDAAARLCLAIEKHTAHPEVISSGLEAMAAMMRSDAQLVDKFEAAGALNVVTATVKPHYQAVVSLWPPILCVLRLLLYHRVGPTHEGSVHGCEVLALLLKACGSSSYDHKDGLVAEQLKEVKRRICGVLMDLTTDPYSTAAFHEAGASRYLCILLTKSRNDEQVQLLGCRAAGNLALHCSPARTFLGDFLPALLKRMLETHHDNLTLLEGALHCLTQMCGESEAREAKNAGAMGHAGMCEVVVDALGKEGDGVVVEAIRALDALLCEQTNVSRFVALNADEALEAVYARSKAFGKSFLCDELEHTREALKNLVAQLPAQPAKTPQPSGQAQASPQAHASSPVEAQRSQAAPLRRKSSAVGAVLQGGPEALVSGPASEAAVASRGHEMAPLHPRGISDRRKSSFILKQLIVPEGSRRPSDKVESPSCGGGRRDSRILQHPPSINSSARPAADHITPESPKARASAAFKAERRPSSSVPLASARRQSSFTEAPLGSARQSSFTSGEAPRSPQSSFNSGEAPLGSVQRQASFTSGEAPRSPQRQVSFKSGEAPLGSMQRQPSFTSGEAPCSAQRRPSFKSGEAPLASARRQSSFTSVEAASHGVVGQHSQAMPSLPGGAGSSEANARRPSIVARPAAVAHVSAPAPHPNVAELQRRSSSLLRYDEETADGLLPPLADGSDVIVPTLKLATQSHRDSSLPSPKGSFPSAGVSSSPSPRTVGLTDASPRSHLTLKR